MWLKLCTCPLSKSKDGVMPLGETAERTQTRMLWVDIDVVSRYQSFVAIINNSVDYEVWAVFMCNLICCNY